MELIGQYLKVINDNIMPFLILSFIGITIILCIIESIKYLIRKIKANRLNPNRFNKRYKAQLYIMWLRIKNRLNHVKMDYPIYAESYLNKKSITRYIVHETLINN